MSPRILIAEPDDFSPRAAEILAGAGEVVLARTPPERLGEALEAFDVVWFRLGHRVDRTLLDRPLRCRILATPVTGLDKIDLEACAERGIRVVALKGETGFLDRVRATAEHTVGLALALLRRLPAASRSVERGEWDRDRFRGGELFEKTAGIVGVGRLGRIVAGYFRAFGMEVLGYDPRPDFPHEAAERVDHLEALFARADLVSVHASYDASTRHLIGERVLRAAKPGAVLINTARGGIVDDRALLAALEDGRLAGAALDVLDGEPEVRDHPLLRFAATSDRLIITPHIGGNTFESFEKTEVFLAEKVVAALR